MNLISRHSGLVDRVGRLITVAVISEQSLRAYTDPGSGTLVWQLLLGGLVGLSFELRRIKNWFSRKFKSENPSDSGAPLSRD
jgi:hypothetical protein